MCKSVKSDGKQIGWVIHVTTLVTCNRSKVFLKAGFGKIHRKKVAGGQSIVEL